MEELVKLVSQKTGLDEGVSKQAAETVLNFLKDKLPEPFPAQLDAFMKGESSLGDFGSIADGLGGLFGKKK